VLSNFQPCYASKKTIPNLLTFENWMTKIIFHPNFWVTQGPLASRDMTQKSPDESFPRSFSKSRGIRKLSNKVSCREEFQLLGHS